MFTDLLSPAQVLVGLDAPDKETVLAALVAAVASLPAVRDAPALLDAVRAREARMTTGVGDGLALPHAHTDAVTAPVAAIAVLARGVDFESLDGQPVRLAVLMAGTVAGRTGHVRLLSRVSRVLGQASVRARLRAAPDARTALAVLSDAEAALG